jgi:hypothetical protein
LSDSLALAEQDFGFTELADDLFGGVSFSWHLTLFPFLILTNSTGSVFGGQVMKTMNTSIDRLRKLSKKVARQKF